MKLRTLFTYGLVLPIACKLLYDHMILIALPEYYLPGISYGVGHIDSIKVMLAYLSLIVLAVITYALFNKPRPYDILITVLFYIYYIPLNSSFYLNDQSYLYCVFSSAYWLLLLLFSAVFDRCKSTNVDKTMSFDMDLLIKNKVFIVCMLLITFGCIAYGYKYNGLTLSLDIVDIYDKRAEFTGTTSLLESFLFNFGGNIIIPLFMIYSLNKKRYLYFAVSIFAQLAIFSVAAQKSQLLVIFVVLIICLAKKMKFYDKIHRSIPWAFFSLLLISKMELLLGKSAIIFSFLVRRLMYIPSWITTMYYDFFADHKKLLLLQDVCLIDGFGLGRYDNSVLDIINKNYFAGYVPSPNAGMFAEAYMHFGAWGVIFFPLLFALILKLLFRWIEKYDTPSIYYLTYAICMALISIPITSGVFVLTYIMLIPFTWFCLKFSLSNRRT